MRNDVNYLALLSVLLLVSQNPVAIFAADSKVTDEKVATSSEQEKSSESTSVDANETENQTEDKDTKDIKEDETKDKQDASSESTEKKFAYEAKEYSDSNGRMLGKYPEIKDIADLDNRIYDDIETAVSELDLSNYDTDNVITFTVTDGDNNKQGDNNEQIDVKPGFVGIYVKVENGYSSNEFKYYVYKANNNWTNSESEYEKIIKELEEKKSEAEKQKSEDSKSSDSTSNQTETPEKVTMVPLRANAEKLGWKVEWEQKTTVEPSKAILTKGNHMIKVLLDPNTDYDLVINRDTTKTFIETGKLSRPAELQDETLYVPSTFIQKLTEEREDRLSKPEVKDTMRDRARENEENLDRDKRPMKPEDRERTEEKRPDRREDKKEDKDIKFSNGSQTE